MIKSTLIRKNGWILITGNTVNTTNTVNTGNTTLVTSINLESLKETTIKTVRDHRISDGCLKFLSNFKLFLQ